MRNIQSEDYAGYSLLYVSRHSKCHLIYPVSGKYARIDLYIKKLHFTNEIIFQICNIKKKPKTPPRATTVPLPQLPGYSLTNKRRIENICSP